MPMTDELSTSVSPRPEDVGLIRLSATDNVLIATRDLRPGRCATASGEVVDLALPVPLGHKVASKGLQPGDKVVRYAMAIGSATAPIAVGEWVHTHNLASDYIQTFAHRGGEE
jgi:altronate dehydratase small subunit